MDPPQRLEALRLPLCRRTDRRFAIGERSIASTRCACRRRGATSTSPPRPRSAIQAWGFDARGRKQYRYNERAVERRELRKYHRVRQLAKELPRIRRTLHDDARPERRAETLDADTVAATVLRLISETFCRVGGERYARENGTFGITTLRKSHVELGDGTARFEYRGKGNIRQRQVVHEPRARAAGGATTAHAGHAAVSLRATGRGKMLTARDVNEYLQTAYRRVQREGFSHMGRNASRGDGARRARAPRSRRPRRSATSRWRCGSCRRSSATRRRSAASRTCIRW